MSLTNYTEALQKTKTYQAGLISFQEYSFQSRLGFFKVLPNMPHADDDRHVVVMEVRGNRPNLLTVLEDPKHSIQATTKDVDKLLFIFVEMRPHTLVIESPNGGYRLGDGHRIDAKFTVTYRIKDAKEFWSGNKDQLAEFEIAAIDAAKNFFLKISSNFLIISPADLKQSLEKHISESEINKVKIKLEQSICETCTVAGISLQKVIADVNIGDSLHKYLLRIHEKLYGEGGTAERRKIDQIIDSDTTFAPYNLRTVINAIDMRLLENFYSSKWSDAMRLVTDKVAEKKEEYMMSIDHKEITKMRELIDIAVNSGLDTIDIDILKTKLAEKLVLIAGKDTKTTPFSDSDYLDVIITSPGHQLESDETKAISIENV